MPSHWSNYTCPFLLIPRRTHLFMLYSCQSSLQQQYYMTTHFKKIRWITLLSHPLTCFKVMHTFLLCLSAVTRTETPDCDRTAESLPVPQRQKGLAFIRLRWTWSLGESLCAIATKKTYSLCHYTRSSLLACGVKSSCRHQTCPLVQKVVTM